MHPHLKKLFFSDHHKNGVNIMSASISGDSIEVLVYDAGEVQSMAIDVKLNKLFWSTYDGKIGTLSGITTEGRSRRREKTFRSTKRAAQGRGILMADFFDGA